MKGQNHQACDRQRPSREKRSPLDRMEKPA
jgi:hypothetical protein